MLNKIFNINSFHTYDIINKCIKLGKSQYEMCGHEF